MASEPPPDDLKQIGVVRIAVGKRVEKSKCCLGYQFGVKEQFVVLLFISSASTAKIRVDLKGDELREMAYFIADDGDDVLLSILVFCVRPSQVNKLVKFSESYDGEDGDKKYITVENRDKDEISVSINFGTENIITF
jgi:hypothetical protein